MRSRLHRVASRVVVDPVVAVARWRRPSAGTVPPGRRTAIEDVAVRRPWNLVVKAARGRARRRVSRLEPGVTVVIVNWNTLPLVRDVVRAIRRFSPSDTRVLVVDNGSTDASRSALRSLPGIDTLLLPANAGHGAALDLGIAHVRTTIAVTLDSDAIPLRPGWLDPAVEPVRSGRALLAGTRASRGFVHPVFAAIDVRAFLTRPLSFQVHLLPGVTGECASWGVDAWDTGELISAELDPAELALVDGGPVGTDVVPGGLVADVVYHHGGVTRLGGGRLDDDAIRGWRAACRALGLGFLDDAGTSRVVDGGDAA